MLIDIVFFVFCPVCGHVALVITSVPTESFNAETVSDLTAQAQFIFESECKHGGE